MGNFYGQVRLLDDTGWCFRCNCQDGRTRKLSARTLWHRWPQDVCRQDVALPLMVFLEVPWMEPGHLKGLWKGHLKADWLCYAGFYCTWSCCACFVHDLTEAFKQAHSYTALMCSEAICLSSCCIITQRFSRESIVKQLLNVSVSMADPLSCLESPSQGHPKNGVSLDDDSNKLLMKAFWKVSDQLNGMSVEGFKGLIQDIVTWQQHEVQEWQQDQIGRQHKTAFRKIWNISIVSIINPAAEASRMATWQTCVLFQYDIIWHNTVRQFHLDWAMLWSTSMMLPLW